MENDFDILVGRIESANEVLQNNARVVINRHVTAKAWLTGYYIVEYEQHGADRAKYGEKLIPELSKRLGKNKYSVSTLKLYRQFYQVYPTLAYEILDFVKTLPAIGQSPIIQLQLPVYQSCEKSQSLIAKSCDLAISAKIANDSMVPSTKLFNKLSFTHLAALLPVEDSLARDFYATMAIRGTWSVRELQRQIDTNYYERSGWSKNPQQLAELVNEKCEVSTLQNDIKSPFTFEFLGLPAKNVVEESDLESAILNHLQDFILELGMGFCFEERQKKLLIDDRYYKADLVFYHRVLKRHVIIELKAHRLDYTDAAQLKMYLAYFRQNIQQPDDNAPIGILMCTEVGQEMVEYLASDMDEEMFISKYKLEIPDKNKMMEFLRQQNQ